MMGFFGFVFILVCFVSFCLCVCFVLVCLVGGCFLVLYCFWYFNSFIENLAVFG